MELMLLLYDLSHQRDVGAVLARYVTAVFDVLSLTVVKVPLAALGYQLFVRLLRRLVYRFRQELVLMLFAQVHASEVTDLFKGSVC